MTGPLVLAQAHDPELVRRTVSEVLAQRDYGQVVPSPLERVIGWLFEQLGRILVDIGAGGDGPQSVGAGIALVVVIVGLLLLLARFLTTVRRSPELELQDSGPVGRPPASWLEEAERHEAAGAWAEALRCRYRLTVARLAEAGLVREIPGRTTGEYLSEVARAVPDARAAFTSLTRAFEVAFYGRREVPQANLEQAKEHAEQIVKVAGLRRKVRAGPQVSA